MLQVYVDQPPGFEGPHLEDHVYKLRKTLYGFKQAPRAWYERLSKFLIEKGFTRGKVDTTLFVKHEDSNLLIIQVYVDDIVFGGTSKKLCKDFANLITSEFEMSLMGELTYLGLSLLRGPPPLVLLISIEEANRRRRVNILSRSSSEANQRRYICASRKIFKRNVEEI